MNPIQLNAVKILSHNNFEIHSQETEVVLQLAKKLISLCINDVDHELECCKTLIDVSLNFNAH